ncbi:hypothetical protein CK203_082554 [Vitis vinifera]|uniref:Uncharacterized protein n=1 Tax=Vitis vinifera TaxID=29760 RepID=A0A438DJX7_VITVI|nr:hypothetical protein CK203_082554 [Vitis vinifera]
MDDLFKRANKYSLLEDDVHAAIQQMAKANQDGFKKTGSEQEMRLSQGSWSYHGTMQKSLLLGRKANKSRTLEAVRLLRRMMKCDGLRSAIQVPPLQRPQGQ